jgi:hypothetical protein
VSVGGTGRGTIVTKGDRYKMSVICEIEKKEDI